ncbi:lysophospholipid acyltransferase family protein [Alicyclobacillus sp.]|uniref:lysophospholipid acyltransferase family protein n=1 Tax=Alicyclobacillus sp. TaxID=61169 RepID=UPI0025C57A33|nr:lysophospholipid acyltransferase family protein [Alicyclobacillus sp.]MCL6515585.1 1-acyl-sn-glycerol-3-phosphate acyltransferase [Alicyclobacillus sp.]
MSEFVVRDPFHEPLYRVMRTFVHIAFRVMFRIRIRGVHHIPRTGPVVIGCNHLHVFDVLLLGMAVPRFVHFMAKEELFRNRFLAALIRYLGAFPVRRGLQDKAAIRNALAVPAHGGCLIVFPEGHRSRDGKLQRGLPGIAFIARKSACPLVPAAIVGPYRLWHRVTIRFGEPIEPNPEDTNESVLETLMTRIQQLLDEGHR